MAGMKRPLALLCLAALAACGSTKPLPPTPDGAREKALFERVLRDLGRQGGAGARVMAATGSTALKFGMILMRAGSTPWPRK